MSSIPSDARARQPEESIQQWIARIDPEVAAAVADVDRTLLKEFLKLTPMERVRACTRATRALARFKPVARATEEEP